MRLKRSRLAKYHLRAAIPKKDNEGSSYIEYGPMVEFEAEEWPGGGKMQSERYGIRLPNIRNLRLEGGYIESIREDGTLCFIMADGTSFSVNDGICIARYRNWVLPSIVTYPSDDLYPICEANPVSEEPDYRIVAIYPYRFLTMEVEKI